MVVTRGRMGQLIEIRDHNYRDLTLEFSSTLHVKVTQAPQCQEGFSYLQGEFYELNLNTLNNMLVFQLAWTCLGVKSPQNLTRMSFRMRFSRIISIIQVHAKAPSLGILVFGWPNACFHVASLLGTIV